jgi:outer membrane protein OmpU
VLGVGATYAYDAWTFGIGYFAIGVAGEYYNDQFSRDFDSVLGENKVDSWVVGVGTAYTMDAWTFGAQYSHREDDMEVNDGIAFPSEDLDFTQDRVVLTAIYSLGPGIQVDGELGYTWVDSDPEEFVNPSLPDSLSDYDGFEFGIGTNITF